METRDYIELILSVLGGLGVLALGLGYAYGKWIEGRNKNTIDGFTILEKEVKVLRDEVAKLTKEIQNVREENASERKKFTEVILAIQGKDPEMQTFMIAVKQYMEDNKPFIENIKMRVIPVVMKLDKFLDGQIIK